MSLTCQVGLRGCQRENLIYERDRALQEIEELHKQIVMVGENRLNETAAGQHILHVEKERDQLKEELREARVEVERLEAKHKTLCEEIAKWASDIGYVRNAGVEIERLIKQVGDSRIWTQNQIHSRDAIITIYEMALEAIGNKNFIADREWAIKRAKEALEDGTRLKEGE
jgi:chromosome segregation ATPase